MWVHKIGFAPSTKINGTFSEEILKLVSKKMSFAVEMLQYKHFSQKKMNNVEKKEGISRMR